MAIVPADLTAPKGEIEKAWFPSDDDAALTARLHGYIDDATARAGVQGIAAASLDAAVRAWSYHRAYRAIWLRLSEQPASLSMNDQGSRSRTDQQRDAFAAESNRYLVAYEALLPASAAATLPRIPGGAAVNSFSW